MIEKGYFFAPYILVEHMEEYYKQHKYCPNCGSVQYTTTLVEYALDINKKDEYKDLNLCECMNCGDKHSVHDRVPSFEALW